MAKYKSRDFCEGEKLPRTSQLSIAMTLDQKKELMQNAHRKRKSVSRYVRDILKKNGAISGPNDC